MIQIEKLNKGRFLCGSIHRAKARAGQHNALL